MKTFFWCDLQKRSPCVFLQTLGAIFWSQTTLGAIFTRIFRDFAQIFRKSKLLGGACTHTSNTTAFHNNIVGNFMVYQDRLETNLLQLLGHPEISEWFSIISVIIFEANIVDEQKQTYLVTIFFIFTSFHCSQLFYCSPCPAPASLDMHVVSTNFAKTLVCKRKYDVILWHHSHRRRQGGQRDHPPKFLENIVILCFERRFTKQNSVIRLKSSIFGPPKFFGPSQIFGLATPLIGENRTAKTRERFAESSFTTQLRVQGCRQCNCTAQELYFECLRRSSGQKLV